jgi:phospholipid/cholesterol/gamma-HCH transport system permease protein
MAIAQLAYVGQRATDALAGFGRFTLFCMVTWRWFWMGARHWGRPSLLLPQLYFIGTKSVPVVMMVGGFIGMVLAIEGYDQFAQLGLQERLGAVIDVSVVKQIGPVLAAVMLAGRVGGSVSAELGTMRVTEQLDALRVMGADPIGYLVVPRVVACVLMIPILTVFSDLTGIYGGYLISVRGFGVPAEPYLDFSRRFVAEFDVITGLIKSVVFGLMIGLIVANFFLAKFLNDVYIFIYGPEVLSAFGG